MGYKKIAKHREKKSSLVVAEAGGPRKNGNVHQRVHISSYSTNNAQNGWVSLKIKREDHKLFSPHRQKKVIMWNDEYIN